MYDFSEQVKISYKSLQKPKFFYPNKCNVRITEQIFMLNMKVEISVMLCWFWQKRQQYQQSSVIKTEPLTVFFSLFIDLQPITLSLPCQCILSTPPVECADYISAVITQLYFQ